MSVRKDEPEKKKSSSEEKEISDFGSQMYRESAKAVREVGARVVLSVAAAILIWLFGSLVFLPVAQGMEQMFFGYPVEAIVSFVIIVALAVIIFTVFVCEILVEHFSEYSNFYLSHYQLPPFLDFIRIR